MKTFSKTLITLVFLFGIFLIPSNAFADSFTLTEGFSYEDLSKDLKSEIDKIPGFKENDYVRTEDLRSVNIKYVGFDDREHDGNLIVHESIAKETLEIFNELFEKKYPIREMSCFCFRNISGTNRLSWHALGLAIDINYSLNPCLIIGKNGEVVNTIPAKCEKYADRTLNEKGLIKHGDDCYNAFASRGWEWGGSWDSPIDYMHFQKFPWYTPKPAPKYKK